MDKMIYILKIIYYFMFVFIMYKIAKINNNKIKNEENNQKRRTTKISIGCIIVLCILYGIYSIICGKYPYGEDRYNFAFRFENDMYSSFTKQESLGLYWLESILHIFTHEPKVLFFISSFLYLLFTLYAYKKSNEAGPLTLLALGLSSYLTFGFYMLKQSIAVSLIAIAFVAIDRNKKMEAIITTILAICFHESAWIIIPIYFALYYSKNKAIRILIYLILIICMIFFNRINQIIINSLIKIIPGFGAQIGYYLNEDGAIIQDINIMTILKGIPFYFITLLGFYKRKQLKNTIKNYDRYMFCCVFVSVATILSMYMYWMFRFAIYCYFPVFVFTSLIYKELNKNEKILFDICFFMLSFALILRLWCQYYFLYGGI